MPLARMHDNTRPDKRARAARGRDAIALLKAEHRQVETWFAQFEDTESAPEKQKLATQICQAIRLHTQIEDEVFYPACRDAGISEDMMDEADVEHDMVRKLVAEVEAGKPGDDHWEARVKVLSELVEHHVKEEEQRDGIFAAAKKADMDLISLAQRMAARKSELAKQN